MEIKIGIGNYEQFKNLITVKQAKKTLETMENSGINQGKGLYYCERLMDWIQEYNDSCGEIMDFDYIEDTLWLESWYFYTAVGLSCQGYTIKEVLEKKYFDELYDTYHYIQEYHSLYNEEVVDILERIQEKGLEQEFITRLYDEFFDGDLDFEEMEDSIIDCENIYFTSEEE